jgi:hypothetical protein
MYFYLSKTLGDLAVPSNFILLVLICGLLRFARLGRRLAVAGIVLARSRRAAVVIAARRIDAFGSRCPRVGGVVCRLGHATHAGAAFETMLRVKIPDAAQKTPLFGPDNLLLKGIEYPDTVFRNASPRLG